MNKNNKKIIEFKYIKRNLNTALQISISGHSLELIDTLWNVNPLTTSLTVPSFSELIDTLWNVKDRT